MSKCTIMMWTEDPKGTVAFEGATVSEALAMKAEYLLSVGGLGPPAATTEQGPPTVKPSGFLTHLKGGE
jgi:hypothetical protein